MNDDRTSLERVLWTEITRLCHGTPAPWRPDSSCAHVLRAALRSEVLDPRESAILAGWDAREQSARSLLERLLQARVEGALRSGLAHEAERLAIEAPEPPVVRIAARDTRPDTHRDDELTTLPSSREPGTTYDELDVAALAPGGGIDFVVDELDGFARVRLRNGDAGVSSRFELRSPAGTSSPAELAAELDALAEILRRAVPAPRRPAAPGSSAPHDLSGTLLGGKYRIKAFKGRGAFKTIYEGEDEKLGARVAIAVLNTRRKSSLARLREEARRLTTLDHENIVRWITFDQTPDGLPYFVMEYLEGEELEALLRREGRLAPRRAGAILLQVLAALKRAHRPEAQGGLLHLDLKPENVFVLPPLAAGEPERVKVIDFGISQHVEAEPSGTEGAARPWHDLSTKELAETLRLPEGALLPGPGRVPRARGGTLLYASPEQCAHLAGEREIVALDGRSDLYSLGVMAFRMLTGEFPFARASSAREAIENHLRVEPRKVGSLGVRMPRALAAFVDRCLVKDREARWRDAGAAHEALERIVRPRHVPLWMTLAVAGLALAASVYLLATRTETIGSLAVMDASTLGGEPLAVLELGSETPARAFALEWDGAGPVDDLRLIDASNGDAVRGWSARWLDAERRTIELSATGEVPHAAAFLEVGTGGRRWRSPRLALDHLGLWRIAGVRLSERTDAGRVDPRGRRPSIQIAGDAAGRGAVTWLALFEGEEPVLEWSPEAGTPAGEQTHYTGPALDRLFTGTPRDAELRLAARDRAGQEHELVFALALAGEAADFGSDTGFVESAAPGAALLPYAGKDQVLIPGQALRVTATGPARLRVTLEPEAEPRVERLLSPDAGALVLTLDELGLLGPAEHAGTLRLTLDDGPWVERVAPEPRTRALPLRFLPALPGFEVELAAPDLDPVRLTPDGWTHVHVGPEARALVRAPAGMNLWLEAAFARPGETALPRRLLRPRGPFELALALPEEGRYELALHAYTLLAGDLRGARIPADPCFRIQVDREAPVVRLALASADGALEDGTPCLIDPTPACITASVGEAGTLAGIRWQVDVDGTRREGVLAPATELDLSELARDDAGEGPREIALEAEDLAGNRAQGKLTWHRARVGPELAALQPFLGTDGRWTFDSRARWNVRVRARDRNGVSALRLRIVPPGREGSEHALARIAEDLWELPEPERPALQPWWAGRELALELVARDVAGLESRLDLRGLVPDLPRAERLVIAPRASDSSPMVELAGGEYVFGGRPGEGRRPWNVTLPASGFLPYFLDVREVSRAEFLAFVTTEDGYAAGRHWPAGSAPDPARRDGWRARLGEGSEEPVSGVTWPEASAYASWRGKRLPSLVEWEFAVRERQYRPSPDMETHDVTVEGSWPANLCAGPREWTATPERLIEEALDPISQYRRYPHLLLAARADSRTSPEQAHWVAGSAADAPPHWSARALVVDQESNGAEVGFRCALDHATALDLLERGAYEVRP